MARNRSSDLRNPDEFLMALVSYVREGHYQLPDGSHVNKAFGVREFYLDEALVDRTRDDLVGTLLHTSSEQGGVFDILCCENFRAQSLGFEILYEYRNALGIGDDQAFPNLGTASYREYPSPKIDIELTSRMAGKRVAVLFDQIVSIDHVRQFKTLIENAGGTFVYLLSIASYVQEIELQAEVPNVKVLLVFDLHPGN